MEKQKKSRFLKVAVTIGIVVVLNLFFNYALSLVYKSPDFNTYCHDALSYTSALTESECSSVGGKWYANNAGPYPVPQATVDVKQTNPANVGYYCNATYTCQNKYDEASRIYNKNVFITLIVFGAATLIAGIFLSANIVVSSGLAYGGVLSFIIASTRYWSSADDLIKVVILGLALIVLIGIAIKKFKD